jgi:hypothetical protein
MILYYTNGTTHHAEYSLEIRYFESYAPSLSAVLNIM